MRIDCLVAEIGSTTTVVNAFNLHQGPVKFLGRGINQTTVDTNVNIGLTKAIADLASNLGVKELSYTEMFASSSAAGGLKITVHGLVYEMTAKAAKQAALNAGANIYLITANKLESEHIEQIKKIKPNMIIIAGGTDFGEKEVAYKNLLTVLDLEIPVIYAGNIANHDRIAKLENNLVKIVENVYPRVDNLNIIPLRKAIYQTFEENIIHAKGMKDIFKLVDQSVVPTPGAVMDATLLLDEIFEGVMTIDVGGATTDIHSVCETKEAYAKYSGGEPRFKRTVEGDLGVFINRELVVNTFRKGELEKMMNLSQQDIQTIIKKEPFIPITDHGKRLNEELTAQCVYQALDRHIGDLKNVFTTNGIKVIPQGKDTSLVKAIFLTGGALLHAENGEKMVREYLENQYSKLVPSKNVKVYYDYDYIFASIGVLAEKYPSQAKVLLKQSIKGNGKTNVS